MGENEGRKDKLKLLESNINNHCKQKELCEPWKLQLSKPENKIMENKTN